jgi:hypothetical protein
VRKLTENKLKNVWDTIYEADKCCEALSNEDNMSFLESICGMMTRFRGRGEGKQYVDVHDVWGGILQVW